MTLDAAAFEPADLSDLLARVAVVPEVDGVPQVPCSPWLTLAVAVLELGVWDARQGDPEATAWVFGEPETPAVGFTFEGLCHALDIDPDALRARIRELPRLRRRWRPDFPRRLAAA